MQIGGGLLLNALAVSKQQQPITDGRQEKETSSKVFGGFELVASGYTRAQADLSASGCGPVARGRGDRSLKSSTMFLWSRMWSSVTSMQRPSRRRDSA